MYGRRLPHALVIAATLAVTGLGSPARAAQGYVDFSLSFSAHAPATATGLALHLVYRSPQGAEAKPLPLSGLTLEFPAGTRFGGDTVPTCPASDAELRLLGDAACPPASRIGGGTLTAVTGLGGGVDPVHTDVSVFRTPDGWVEVVVPRGGGPVLALDRATVTGSTAVLHPPTSPGGPPDFRTTVRDIDLTFAATGYVVTPASCPSDGVWRSATTATFAGGLVDTEHAATPCDRPARRAAAPALRLQLQPRSARAGRRVMVRAQVRSDAGHCVRGAVVRLAGRSARTDAAGRATLRVRFRRPGVRTARVTHAGCRAARAQLVVRRAR